MPTMQVGLAITGASGVRVGLKILDYLAGSGYTVHTVISEGAYRVFEAEDGLSREQVRRIVQSKAILYGEHDFTSPLASSSSVPRTFIIAPASMKTIAALAHGYASNLVVRAAHAVLRLRGRLVVAPRETPLSLIDIENMARLARAGAVVVPLCVGFYNRPETVDDIVGFLAGKILDAAGIDNNLYRRWSDARSSL